MKPTINDLWTTIETRRITERAREYRNSMLDDNPAATRAKQKQWFEDAFIRGIIEEDVKQAVRYRKVSEESEENERRWLAEQFRELHMPRSAFQIEQGKTPTRCWGIELATEMLRGFSGGTHLSCKLGLDAFDIYATAISIVAKEREPSGVIFSIPRF